MRILAGSQPARHKDEYEELEAPPPVEVTPPSQEALDALEKLALYRLQGHSLDLNIPVMRRYLQCWTGRKGALNIYQ